MSKQLWDDNRFQFPRLLSEIRAVAQDELIAEVAESMDLEPNAVWELLDRAEIVWNNIKEHERITGKWEV